MRCGSSWCGDLTLWPLYTEIDSQYDLRARDALVTAERLSTVTDDRTDIDRPADRPAGPRGVLLLAAVLALVLVVSVLAAIGLGSAIVPPADTMRYLWAAVTGGTISADEVTRYQIIWQIRTPRVLLAAVVGAGLAAVGAAIQALVRNSDRKSVV